MRHLCNLLEFKPTLYSRCSENTLLDDGLRFVSDFTTDFVSVSRHASKKAGDIVTMPPAK
jgi:hypothetical protein